MSMYMTNAGTLPKSISLSDESGSIFDAWLNKGKELIGQGEKEFDKNVEAVEEAVKSSVPTTDKEKEGILTKVKRKFNDADPLLIGGIGAGASWMIFKTGPLTTAIVGGLCYLGKMQLDKSGGLSDTFAQYDMDFNSVTPDGKELYTNKTNGRLYYISGVNNQGVPVYTQYN